MDVKNLGDGNLCPYLCSENKNRLYAMDEIKTIVVTLLSGIAAYLHPIADNVFAMFWLLAANFLVGLLCGVIVNHEDFQWRKAWQCMIDSMVLFGIVAFIYAIGRMNGNESGSIQCVSLIIYAMCYFYGVNILRNVRSLLKEESTAWMLIDFLYSVLSMEYARRIPGLDKYINKHGKHRKADAPHPEMGMRSDEYPTEG